VLTEILKDWHHRGEEPPVFFWRDTDGHEVDFVLQRAGRLHPVEVKARRTVQPDFLQGIRYLGAQDESVGAGLVVYGGDSRQTRGGMTAVPWQKLSAALDGIRNAG
jgi:predicted AAA+ superfamily ATPase